MNPMTIIMLAITVIKIVKMLKSIKIEDIEREGLDSSELNLENLKMVLKFIEDLGIAKKNGGLF